MATYTIDINTQTLIDTATKVNSINNDLDDKLKEINRKMNDLEQHWMSDAASDIRAAMNSLQPRFEQYKNIVTEYEKFLRNTAASYESTEQAVQTNANAFM